MTDDGGGRALSHRPFPWTRARRICLGFGLIGSLAALGAWLVRPGPFVEWWGVMGLGEKTPLQALANWYRFGGPWTPSGLYLVFPGKELLVVGALLFLMVFFAFLLAVEWGPRRLKRFEWQELGPLCRRMSRMRSRALLALIAVLCAYLGWEIAAWRAWHARLCFRQLALEHEYKEQDYRRALRMTEERIDQLKRDPSLHADENETEAARAASFAFQLDGLREDAAEYARLADNSAALKRTYEHAATAPWRPIALIEPSRAPLDLSRYGFKNDPGRALAICGNLLERYPDLVWARWQRAWILATCPDPRFRDGKQAVVDARRAVELTNRKDDSLLEVLAAACAEAGDFPSAARWEDEALGIKQQTLDRQIAEWKRQHPKTPYRDRTKVDRARLNRYKARMPYRDDQGVGYW